MNDTLIANLLSGMNNMQIAKKDLYTSGIIMKGGNKKLNVCSLKENIFDTKEQDVKCSFLKKENA